jgi:hypothetical protein
MTAVIVAGSLALSKASILEPRPEIRTTIFFTGCLLEQGQVLYRKDAKETQRKAIGK